MHTPGLLLASSLLVGAVVVAGSQVIGLAYPMLRPRIDRLAPEDRTQVLGFLAVLLEKNRLGRVIPYDAE